MEGATIRVLYARQELYIMGTFTKLVATHREKELKRMYPIVYTVAS